MTSLMVTWTDIFEGTGKFFYWIFKGMRVLGQGPNVCISIFIIGMLVYWTMHLRKYKKRSKQSADYIE